MFVTKILQVLLLSVLNDWCSSADIDSIFSDFFTKNKDPKSKLDKESLFSDLRSNKDQQMNKDRVESIFSDLKSNIDQQFNRDRIEPIFSDLWSDKDQQLNKDRIESIFSDLWSNKDQQMNKDRIESIFSDLRSNKDQKMNKDRIELIFSDLWSNKDQQMNKDRIESIFSDLNSNKDQQPSSGKELLNSVPKRGNQVTRTNPVEDDRPVLVTSGPTKAEDFPNFKSTNPPGEQNGRATTSGTTRQPQRAQTTPQRQSNSDRKNVRKFNAIVKVDEDVGEPLYVPKKMKDFVTSPSMIYCLNYCTFPVNYPLAYGGTDAIPHEFPHMVALGFGSGTFQGKSLVSWNICGGSLISKNFVLTAAHCLDSDRGPPTQVRVGEHDLSKLDVVVPAQDFPILRIIIHPGYNSSFVYHDIALLQLARDVPFTRAWNLPGSKLFKVIWPACLHQGLNVKRYENEREYQNQEVLELPHQAVATGWGNTGFVDAPSDILQKVDLDVIDHQTCKRLLGRDALIPNGVDEKTQVCAGVLAGGRDTCNGDSGGPLQINNKMFYWHRYCPMEIVGITN